MVLEYVDDCVLFLSQKVGLTLVRVKYSLVNQAVHLVK